MTAGTIITNFELQVSDMTELSSAEELMVLNRVRRKINRRQLEANRTPFTDTQSTTVPYIALPSDFYNMAANYDFANNNTYADKAYVLVGANNDPYEVIPYADRNRYINANNKAYLDIPNNRLVFTLQPTAANSVSFDYYALPADFTTTSQTDWITNLFPDALVYGMATEDFIIQLSDKAKSYQQENQAKFNEEMGNILSWNMSLLNM